MRARFVKVTNQYRWKKRLICSLRKQFGPQKEKSHLDSKEEFYRELWHLLIKEQ